MRGFETLCNVTIQSFQTLSMIDPDMDQDELVSFTVDQTMSTLAHPVAVIDLVLEQPEILGWKAPDDPVTRSFEGAAYIKAAIRTRVEESVLAALDS